MDTATVDLLALIGHDVSLRKAAGTGGGEYVGACPWCGGQDKRNPDRFHVWPERGRYWCRQCDRKGDAIQYVRDRRNLGYREALAALGLPGGLGQAAGPTPAPTAPPIRPAHDPAEAPGAAWQAAGRSFAGACAAALWRPEGARALAWLHGRGLDDSTIRAAGLGYNPTDAHHDRAAWGLEPDTDENGRPKRVWLPRGVVIPWEIGGDLWRVNIRRPAGDPKYIGPAGSAVALYGADALTPARPAVLAEGELDALTVGQYAGDLVTAVATGSTAGARRARWIARLAVAPLVLVAFDGDDPGEHAARWWLDVITGARRWRSYYGKDANGLAQSGGDVRAWVVAGLDGQAPTATGQPGPGAALLDEQPGAVIGGQVAAPLDEQRAAEPVIQVETGTPAAVADYAGPWPVPRPTPTDDLYQLAVEQILEGAGRWWPAGFSLDWIREHCPELWARAESKGAELEALYGQGLDRFMAVLSEWADAHQAAAEEYRRAVWADYDRQMV